VFYFDRQRACTTTTRLKTSKKSRSTHGLRSVKKRGKHTTTPAFLKSVLTLRLTSISDLNWQILENAFCEWYPSKPWFQHVFGCFAKIVFSKLGAFFGGRAQVSVSGHFSGEHFRMFSATSSRISPTSRFGNSKSCVGALRDQLYASDVEHPRNIFRRFVEFW